MTKEPNYHRRESNIVIDDNDQPINTTMFGKMLSAAFTRGNGSKSVNKIESPTVKNVTDKNPFLEVNSETKVCDSPQFKKREPAKTMYFSV